MENLLEGKTAIITGARRGIGKATCQLFAENGANVYACLRKADAEFDLWAECLEKENGVFVKPVYFDVANIEEIKKGMKEIFSDKNSIDVLVNNAGIASAGTLRMTSIETLKNVFDINYFAPIVIMQIVAGKMIRQRRGSIINIASVGGVEAQPGYLAYGSSKAALIWATRSISKELGNFNVRVNAVAPGQTNTDMGGVYKSSEEIANTIQRTALHRMAESNEIANTILFLASDLASYVTGEIMQVDGGRV